MSFTVTHSHTKREPYSILCATGEENCPMDVVDIQYNNPLYDVIFAESLKEPVEFNQMYSVLNDNTVVSQKGRKRNMQVFFKYAPLLDPIHFLIGKYEKEKEKMQNLPKGNNADDCISKIVQSNNSSYIDNFFNFLSSQLLHHHNISHCIDYFGSNLAIQKKFKYNVYDDLDYLQESDFFLKNANVLYELDADEVFESQYHSKNTQSRRPKLCIASEDVCMDDIIAIVEDDDENETDAAIKNDTDEHINGLEEVEEVQQEKETITLEPMEEVMYEHDIEIKSLSSSSDDDSVICNTSDDESDSDKEVDNHRHKGGQCNRDVDEGEIDEDDEDDDEDDEDDSIYAYLYNFPVQMIALEKCDGTLDELLEYETLNEKEAASALLQVIFTLIVYQKTFQFTHNDLHTNNIVYKETKKKFLSYRYNKKHYKIPTYGRIYKIIDFGRSIYRYKDNVYCSDSFAPGGDAHGQYNDDPYFNPSKARLVPNMSFDLCRLGCSMYDFVFDSEAPLPTKMTELQKTVLRWCEDDYGKNILYKRNGDERYPNFKLYKMISRMVHNHTPESQLQYPYFSQFLSTHKVSSDVMDIDQLPYYG